MVPCMLRQISLAENFNMPPVYDDVIKWNIFRVTGRLSREFPAQWPVTWSYDVFFDLRLEKTVE